jgi:FAD:protein FMN transferase
VLHATSFRAMGTTVDIELETPHDPGEAFDVARELFELQESRFSRFRPDSLLARFNRGEAIDDEAFVEVVRLAVEAHDATGGLFNPMVLPALEAAGYACTFDRINAGNPVPQAIPSPADVAHCDGHVVQLLAGAFDLGGMAKGWTADLCANVLSQFADGVVVNAGGDLRVIGDPGDRPFGIACPVCGELTWTGSVQQALATSTTWKRRWQTSSGGTAHHIIDPRDGLPARSPFTQVSVFAPSAVQAETWAKAILIGGDAVARAAQAAGFEVQVVSQCDTHAPGAAGLPHSQPSLNAEQHDE